MPSADTAGCWHVQTNQIVDGWPQLGRGPRPPASHAAAGAKRSRPSNVRLTESRAHTTDCVNSTAVHAGSAVAAPARTARCRARRTAGRPPRSPLPRRVEPTPGSTTATKTVPCGKYGDDRLELERAGQDVLRRDVVRDVDERRLRADAEHDALHRGDVVVAQAEVGEQRDDRSRHAEPRSAGFVGRLAEEDLPQVVLQEERIGHAQPLEQPDDVAIREHRLAATRRGIRPVLQVHVRRR